MTEEVHTVKQASSLPTVTNLADADRVLVLTGGTTFARAPETALQVERWAEADARYNALSGTVASLTGASNIVGAFSAASRAALVLDVAAGRLDDVVDGALVWASPLGSVEPVAFKKQSGATMFADLPGLVYAGQPRPEHHTENVTPGVTDMTAALQWVIDQKHVGYLAQTVYAHSQPLNFAASRNSGFVGHSADHYPANNQTNGRTFSGSCLRWIGGASTSAQIIASARPLGDGTVSSAFHDSVFGVVMRNVVLDGQNLVDYGFYGFRLQNALVENLIVTRHRKHGFWAHAVYNGSFSGVTAMNQQGCGITFGRGDMDFGMAQEGLNAVHIQNLWGYQCGRDKAFDETTNPLWGYGVYVAPHRGQWVFGVRAENNDGASFIWAPSGSGNCVYGLYVELSNKLLQDGTDAIADGRASRSYAVIWHGRNAGGYGNTISDGMIYGETIWLRGTAPSTARDGQINTIRNISVAGNTRSEWAGWCAINCDPEINTILAGGVAPSRVTGSVNGFLSVGEFGIHAAGRFHWDGSAVVTENLYNIASITRAGTGLFDVSIDDDMADGTYSVICTPSQANRVAFVATGTKTAGSFRIGYHSTPSTFADPGSTAPLDFIVIGRRK